MAYDDIFPTRTGNAIGTSGERQMLDNAQGSNGIVKRVRDNLDGTTTRLGTRGGHPEFITEGGKKLCWKPSTTFDYGFVDTRAGEESSGPLQYLIDEIGQVQQRVKVKDAAEWKTEFYTGLTKEKYEDGIQYGGLPSNYSGLMRRLMQVVHGKTQEKHKTPYEVRSNEECPIYKKADDFSCSYAKTHGMFISESGRRWIIEISPDGIFRIPIRFEKEFSSKNVESEESEEFAKHATYAGGAEAVGKYWNIVDFSHKDKVRIGDSPSSYADGYSPLYAWCGWAFNYTGRSATLALVRPHPTEGTWHQSALFDVSISGAGDDDVPSYAEVVVAEVSPLASPQPDEDKNTGVAALQVASAAPGSCVTMPIYSPKSTGPIKAPLFAYFSPGGQKLVYYFERYSSYPFSENFSSNWGPISVSVDVVGQAIVGSEPNDIPQYRPHPDPDGVAYQADLFTQTSGDVARQSSGFRGGWYGFSGYGFPNQDVDEALAVSRAYIDGAFGGYAVSPLNPLPGVSLTHWSVVRYWSGTQENAYTWYEKLPGVGDNVRIAVQAQGILVTSETTHNSVTEHVSTLIAHGYDRESVALAFTSTKYEGGRGATTAYSGKAIYGSGFLYGTAPYSVSLTTNCVGFSVGSKDPGFSTENGDRTRSQGEIVGMYNIDSLTGLVFGISNLIDRPDTIGINGVVPAAMAFTIPEKTTETSTLTIHIAGQVVEESLNDSAVHKVYRDGEKFLFFAGASGFKIQWVPQRHFYSVQTNGKPKVENVGGYVDGSKDLFGFLGVF